ncbi:hypothetical protein Cni_G18888 [Canna indica]|uniref:Uncharacterized protein n=1 Tax=Canna indica TaxID=4628 RepID=A0AAQ3KK04_9LILI|nr:hypothetical protein Cni_G18888 [Canna indica]
MSSLHLPGNRTPSSAKQRLNTKSHFDFLKTQYYLRLFHRSYVSEINGETKHPPKLAKRMPTKVIYIASPMRMTTTAAALRSLLQKFTGRDSDVATHA